MKIDPFRLFLAPCEKCIVVDDQGKHISGDRIPDDSAVLIDTRTTKTDTLRGCFNSVLSHLGPAGQVCIVFNNRISYERLQGRNPGAVSYTHEKVIDIVKRSGMQIVRTYVLYPGERKAFDRESWTKSVSLRTFTSIKSFIKSGVLRHSALFRFQPAYAVVCARKHMPSYIDLIGAECGIQEDQELLFGNPNTVLMLTKKQVVRIPMDRPSLLRARFHKCILKEIAHTSFAHYVPSFLGQGKRGGISFFRESRLSGVSIGSPVHGFDDYIIKAADFIGSFHSVTSHSTQINDHVYKRLINNTLSRLSAHGNGSSVRELDHLKAAMRRSFYGATIPTVWFHGDYKIENLLFSKDGKTINGVIDWDLSRKEGLPLLDVLYLLLYRDHMATGREMHDTFINRYLKSGFDQFEKTIIERYMARLGIKTDLLQPLLIMFWIHHITHRYQAQLESSESACLLWKEENIHNALQAIAGKLP